MDEKIQREILQRLTQLEILQRVNNVLLSKFILQLQTVKKELHLPKIKSYWKFELLESEYVDLIKEFGRKEIDETLFFLDRQLCDNKINCPNNIKAYIRQQMKRKEIQKRYYKNRKIRETQGYQNDGEEEKTE